MKRIFALALVLCMAFAMCTLTACNNKTDNLYEDFEDFDSYVPKNSEIIGTWKMTAPDTDMEWQFFANTSLHMTKIVGDTRTSTVCTYNYDGEGNLRTYIFNDKVERAYTVVLEGKNLTLTDTAGEIYTFERIK